MRKKLDPLFLDYATYIKMLDDIEHAYHNNTPMPDKTAHDVPVATTIIPIKKDHDFTFVSLEKERTVVCFQSSNDRLDWISNFRFLQGIRFGLHGGIFHCAVKFKKELLDLVDPDKKIVVVGHSRGGALALFIAIFLYKKLKVHIAVMSFGSPRVVGNRYKKMFNSFTIHYNNVRNRRDPVCRLGIPLFKNVGCIKSLPVPFLWNFNLHKRHTGYFENIKRLS